MANTWGLDPNALSTQTTAPQSMYSGGGGWSDIGGPSAGGNPISRQGYDTTTYQGPGGTWKSSGGGMWTGAGGQQVGDLSGYLGMKNLQKTGADFSGYQNQLQGLLTDPSKIQQTAGYQFAVDQGNQAINRSAAAKGMSNSGNVLAELAKYGQGMASQQYDTQTNRLADLMRGSQQFGVQSGYYQPPQNTASNVMGTQRTFNQPSNW